MLVRKFSGRTATAIIPFPGDNILLIKRKTVPFVGYWALPGGRTEPGETVEETVIREVKEETGLKVTIIRKIGEYHEEGVHQGVAYDYYPACFLVKPSDDKIRKQDSEIEEIQLFNLTNLPGELAFEHVMMIKDFLSQKQTNLD
jgi:ADP-ribose pyrophosphatase YjhB (NUDIX family)